MRYTNLLLTLTLTLTDKQTNRLTLKSYPRRPTESAWVIIIFIVRIHSMYIQQKVTPERRAAKYLNEMNAAKLGQQDRG